ncbi:hypothetical protein V1264_017234 [Littorina saxatilis]|uniref:Uncharacterized protein n=1 Tax=Littorina saxatilis TaxID=31220 RepID=A0AAN9BIQ3_9CAEN
MKSTLVFLFFCSLRWKKIVGADSVDDKACDIEIPPLPTFTVEEGREGAIRFDLISNCSTTTDNGVVRLSQQDGSGTWWDQCVVYYPLYKKGPMIRQTCGCYAVKGPSHIRCNYLRTMSRKDNSPWKLYAIGATHINEKSVIVNVIYKPHITQFAIGSHNGPGAITVNKGARDIDVNCSYTNGNPRDPSEYSAQETELWLGATTDRVRRYTQLSTALIVLTQDCIAVKWMTHISVKGLCCWSDVR